MQKNDLIHNNGTIFRILAINDSNALVIDCLKRNMPQWRNIANIDSFEPCTEQELAEQTDVELLDIESLDSATRKIVHDRYTIIAGVLPFITDDKMRSMENFMKHINNQQYIKAIESELRRLREENQKLRGLVSDKGDIIPMAKKEYEKLLSETKMLKDKYTELVAELTILKKRYREEMNKLLSSLRSHNAISNDNRDGGESR